MGAYDHYEEARAVADALEARGRAAEAEKMRSAILEGRSGTEIFTQLRFYLSCSARPDSSRPWLTVSARFMASSMTLCSPEPNLGERARFDEWRDKVERLRQAHTAQVFVR